MKSKHYRSLVFVALLLALFVTSCGGSSSEPAYVMDGRVSVAINDMVFPTDLYHRIPYTLKFWEFEKEGLTLQEIRMYDQATGNEIFRFEKDDLPFMYKDPLDANPYFTSDRISHYYMSIQIPVPLDRNIPAKIFHKFTFVDRMEKQISFVAAAFSPIRDGSPLRISSPVRGRNWIFVNQSTMDYHFYVLFFKDGQIYRGERFAFDNGKVDEDWTGIFSGDPKENSSYFNYGETLYAVAGGTVITVRDGRPENHGDAQDVEFTSIDEYGGNYIIIQIGIGEYAVYAHCVPGSFMVQEGDYVNEGDPIALLGNSGNSTAPHLHFQIVTDPELLFTIGLPFVLKSYIKEGDFETGRITPTLIENSMMEETTIISFED